MFQTGFRPGSDQFRRLLDPEPTGAPSCFFVRVWMGRQSGAKGPVAGIVSNVSDWFRTWFRPVKLGRISGDGKEETKGREGRGIRERLRRGLFRREQSHVNLNHKNV